MTDGRELSRSTTARLDPLDVPRGDRRVALEPAPVVVRDVETREALAKVVRLGGEPVDERDVRLRAIRKRPIGPPLLDSAVPRADVLADVAAVHLHTEMLVVLLGDRVRRLRPVGEAACRVERAGLLERVCRACVDAEPAAPAVELQRRRRL